jgi:hypothetical protein
MNYNLYHNTTLIVIPSSYLRTKELISCEAKSSLGLLRRSEISGTLPSFVPIAIGTAQDDGRLAMTTSLLLNNFK